LVMELWKPAGGAAWMDERRAAGRLAARRGASGHVRCGASALVRCKRAAVFRSLTVGPVNSARCCGLRPMWGCPGGGGLLENWP
jgi:hypothetical protein